MSKTIALVGNPNCGKTTLFNALTGSNQYVGNWPGVTVEKKQGKLKANKEVIITDLPGIYSLSPYTLEEVVARNYLMEEHNDIILNIIDGSNIERNLYLTTQLLELGVPVVVAVNMMDVVKKNGDQIDLELLSKELGCPVVGISSLKNEGIDELSQFIQSDLNTPVPMTYSTDVEKVIVDIENKIETAKHIKRFVAVKLFERDEKLSKDYSIDIEALISQVEESEDDDSESIITNERYSYIQNIVSHTVKKNLNNTLTLSDKIDRIVTNRFLALPIFAVVMFLVYYVSISTVGTYFTDFVNEGVFGEGFELLGRFIPSIPMLVEGLLESIGVADWLLSLINDGIIAGVGAVLGFVPQMLVLFAFLAFLEGCGYMSRIAFIMDRIFKRFGLSGKSFIPMLIGTGCSVPGIMASRTIEGDRDRKMTIMTTSFMPCSAKLPIIALIAGALFSEASWVAPSAYFVGIAAIIISGIILKKTKIFAGDPSPFVMELPAYHMPTLTSVLRSMWERGWSFIKKAGTIILLSSIVIWFVTFFGFVDGQFRMLEDTELNYSILAVIGNAIAWIFTPLGFGNWQSAVASITGLVAKENVVGTFGIVYGFVEVAEDGVEYWPQLAASFTMASAYSFLIFNLLCTPCFAAVGAMRRELNNAKWFTFAICYQTVFAYIIAFIVYQIFNACLTGVIGISTVLAAIMIVCLIYLICRPYKEGE